ncbi:MAG TPA: tetratricopeptide repeat protein, partial [Pirellulaceae bacterium]|nr:tetratricopeptide repeat protein [Pirellulaceae bacterium]
MSRCSLWALVGLLLSVFAPQAAPAQNAVLSDLYGRGVHAFFSQKYDRAHELLTAAIDNGSRDPRCYYFRGLSYSRLGRPDEAQADFTKGAE